MYCARFCEKGLATTATMKSSNRKSKSYSNSGNSPPTAAIGNTDFLKGARRSQGSIGPDSHHTHWAPMATTHIRPPQPPHTLRPDSHHTHRAPIASTHIGAIMAALDLAQDVGVPTFIQAPPQCTRRASGGVWHKPRVSTSRCGSPKLPRGEMTPLTPPCRPEHESKQGQPVEHYLFPATT
jgi:hypothetical protein